MRGPFLYCSKRLRQGDYAVTHFKGAFFQRITQAWSIDTQAGIWLEASTMACAKRFCFPRSKKRSGTQSSGVPAWGHRLRYTIVSFCQRRTINFRTLAPILIVTPLASFSGTLASSIKAVVVMLLSQPFRKARPNVQAIQAPQTDEIVVLEQNSQNVRLV